MGEMLGSVGRTGWSIERIRQETPGCERVVHLNNAGCALPCQRVIHATREFYNQEVTTGGYESVRRYANEMSKPYDKLAALLNCQADEIAILPSATSAWQQVVFGMEFNQGDVVLTTPNEYGSNFINLLQLRSRRGIEIRVIPERGNGDLDLEQLEEMAEKLSPKLLSLTHVPTSSGSIYDAENVGRIAQAYNVPFLLDACQSVGQLDVDVKKIKCDFLSGTSRKFLRGPRGIGFLYASQTTRELYEPACLDIHGAVWESESSYSLVANATRYEQYEINFASKVGFGVAVEHCLELGIDWIADRVRSLANILRDRLSENPNVHVHDQGSSLCGIVSFTVDGYTAEEVRCFLEDRGINVSVSMKSSTRLKLEEKNLEDVVRASVHYYNTEKELEKCASLLKSM